MADEWSGVGNEWRQPGRPASVHSMNDD